MKINLFLFAIAFVGCIGSVAGQGRIVMLNGNERRFSTVEVKGDVIVYQPEGSKKMARRIDRFDVFSIVRDTLGEELIYKPDTVTGDDPPVEEVRDYIKGEKYAKIVYRKPLNFITGVVAGGAGSMIGYYGLIVPAVYPAVLGCFTPKLKEPVTHTYDNITGRFLPTDSSAAGEKIVITDGFTAGYGRKARNMKVKNSLFGGAVGFALGIAVLVLID